MERPWLIMSLSASSWTSIHAFYRGDLDRLLVNAVRPLLDELRTRALIDGYVFQRHWDGGPHLRLRLSTRSEHPDVRDLALGRLGNYLRACPSEDPADPGRYRVEAARRAAEEDVVEYRRAPMPNNTAHEIPYEPEYDRFGRGPALATVERHFVESSRIALGLIAAGLSPDQRHTVAFSAILLSWHGTAVGPPRRDPDHEARYRRRRDGLHALAARMAEIAGGTSNLPPRGALTAWWRTIGTLPGPAVVDRCTGLFCNRLGIGAREERYLRFLAARTLTSEGGSR